MKTLTEINAEAKKYAPDCEPIQYAFVAGAMFALTGRYYKPAELFGKPQPDTVDLEVIQDPIFEGENDTFEDWWQMYGKKRGKKKAKQKWDRLTKQQQTACLLATPAYVASIDDKQFQKDPLTYLNGECWNDEIIPTKQDNEQQRNIQRAQRSARLVASAYRQG